MRDKAVIDDCTLQGTKAEGAIQKLFVGKMKSYIKCVNVDFESSRIEEFNGRACDMLKLRKRHSNNLYKTFS